ncbi:MAG: hypothetical protein H7Y31_09080 [Chitinophagaceae bacterium]|nr:hypothetical protein [Chitinophagaceae bacterium]
MKKAIFTISLAFVSLLVSAQHYYKDILVIKAANQKHKLYHQHKVNSITFASFDGEGQPIEGFTSGQNFNKDFTEVVTRSSNTLSGASVSTSWFNSSDQLIKTQDTAEGVKTITTYAYNASNQIVRINNTTTSAGDFSIREVHEWTYNDQGKPLKMLKIKNGKDSTFVEFVMDEKGNLAEEKSTLKGRALPAVYYYYDDSNNLTDIVRYNSVAKRLLPDYVFEYDENNRLGSMLVVPEEGSDYQKWYYSYDEDGLKILDACYSKSKVLIGRVEYRYIFN